jgi:hypothetical protein
MMLEAYDRDKTEALLQEARTVAAGLKIEVGEIATQMSHVLEGADEVERHAPDLENQRRPEVAIPGGAAQEPLFAKSFWQFWR